MAHGTLGSIARELLHAVEFDAYLEATLLTATEKYKHHGNILRHQ